MKIAISGAHSQGKTTLVNRLKSEPVFKDYVFCTNLTRNIKDLGYPINEKGSEATQLAIMAEHYRRITLGNNLILDRCALDGIVYTASLFGDRDGLGIETFSDAIGILAENLLHQYDRIFYVIPELPLVSDNVRTTDQAFFNNVVLWFDSFIKATEAEIKNKITFVSGTVEERVTIVLNTVHSLETI